jgi:flagellar biosynthesis protein FlhB
MSGERTEAATPRKLETLRKEGRVTKSADLASAAGLLVGLVTLRAFAGDGTGQLTAFIEGQFRTLARPDLTDQGLADLGLAAATLFFVVSAPLLVAMPLAGILSTVGQMGFLVSGKAAAPQFSRINPLAGFKRLFSLHTAVELIKSLVKLGVVGHFTWKAYAEAYPTFMALAGTDLAAAVGVVVGTAVRLGFTVGGALLVLGVLDYGYQRWDFFRNARMSKQDIKDEHKQSEGSPEIKAAIRRRQRRMAMSRMMQNVPTADVVVTNPTHFAVALSYRADEMDAPRVVAKGTDLIAARIKEIAAKHGVPVVENKPLARALYATVEVDREVPFELFQAVAQVLAYIYSLRARGARRGA